ncbi:MAG: sulfotransferase [Tepidisphaeraceae bacterium]
MISSTGHNLAFLLGVPRSGTTLLGVMLAKHPQIACPPEPWIMLALQSMAQTSHRNPAGSQALGAAFEQFSRGEVGVAAKRAFAVTAYNQKLEEAGKSFLIDKTPRYFLILPSIRALFPDAKWFWLQRNPLAVAASYKSTWNLDIPRLLAKREDNWAYYDFMIGLDRLLAFSQAMGPSLFTVQYETLVSEAEPELAKIVQHLGLPPAEGLSNFDLSGSEMATAYAGDKKITATHSPHTQSVSAWEGQFSNDQLQILLDAIGAETFVKLGYGDVVARLAERGVHYSGEEVTAAWRHRGEAALADRLADVQAMSSDGLYAGLSERLGFNGNGIAGGSLVDLSNQAPPLRRELSEAKRMAAQQRVELAQARKAARRLESLVQTREKEAASLGADLAGASARAASLEAELAQASERAVSLERELELQATAKAQELHAAAEQNNGLAKELCCSNRRMEELKVALEQQEEGVARLEAEAAALRKSQESLTAERNLWSGRAGHYESLLQRIDQLRWYERIYDTAGRLAINAVVGRQYLPPRRKRPLPRLSIVTPVRNGREHIRDAIRSVLAQNYPNLEYIIVDGGSTDGTLDIVNEYAGSITRIISEPDNGMYDAVAKGMLAATGDVCGYLNADDMYEPGGLMRVGEYFRDHPRASVIYHEDTVMVNGWRFPNIAQPHVDLFHLLKRHILFQDGVFFKRSAFWAVGGVNRSMRLAGDWDLWTRLSRRYQFRRVGGHISCFRVRQGQLSTDMGAYNAELAAARQQFLGTFGLAGRMRLMPRHLWNGMRNAAERWWPRRRKFFPMDFANMPPPPGEAPELEAGRPICPLTGECPDRLLFSTRDTRFGDTRINYVYYHSKTDIALAYPPMSPGELNKLYESHYSNADAQILPGEQSAASPYRRFRGGGRFDRFISRRSAPYKVIGKLLGPWKDKTGEELLANLQGIFPRQGGNVSFLDVGCFDGKLLDELKEATDWNCCGVEPNAKAVEAARAKGHDVWHGGAEDAALTAPAGRRFDVIFLGQTIEHVQDAPIVLRRLATLLAPGGRLVLSTPNLDSKQIELFGPTWAHWHMPYHRTLFSRKSLGRLARCANMEVCRWATYSHPYWTALSLQLNDLGLGGAVPHGQKTLEEKYIYPAQCLTAWSKMLWDWRGRGDYIYVVLKNKEAT